MEMKKLILISVMIIMVLGLTQSCLGKGNRGIGLGAHYKDNCLSYVASFRTKVGLITLDSSLDYCPPMDEISYVLTPRISLFVNILGTRFYAGAGIEKSYIQWTSGTSEWSNLVYILQGGWEIFRLGAVSLSLDAQYKLSLFPPQEINPEFITFGARLFFYF